MADSLGDIVNQGKDVAGQGLQTAQGAAGQVTKTATDTAGGATKQTPLRADFEKKAGQLQRRQPRREGRYDDYEDDEDESEPDFQLPHRQGKRRLVPVRQSRIPDRPVSDKGATMNIKIELDLEVEVEIYARVKGDVTIGLL
ncbi:hypothetical protein E2P81_ATG00008 [Venturia nashicola]|uniref:Uncharacterized protein n=1 Tax=Venturia nashicola TaxID=86259 RepID=A0A4Z1PCM9_9PEZI|nr:hypothetical protein E6O75_ATG00012 [Venturia nashicola]TLD39021.1 hypothetical protein E2P81_ATG00008 [Venturia nashicola]